MHSNGLLLERFNGPEFLQDEMVGLNTGIFLQEIHFYRPRKNWPSMILTLSDPGDMNKETY